MPFIVPPTADIWTRIKGAFRTYLPGTDAWVEPNNLSITGRAFALALKDVYRRIEYLYRQLFASTADGYHLEFRHAFDLGITRKPSSSASGRVIVQQSNPPATIPAGITLVRGDGVTYLITEDISPDAFGTSIVNVVAVQSGENTNAAGNSSLGVLPASISTYPTLPSSVTVAAAGIGGGADPETDASLRARVLFRKRNPPAGGAKSDYVGWATDIAGCTRAFVSSFAPISDAVTVFPMFDFTRADGIPEQADLDAVAAYIDTVRPITADVYVVAPRAAVVPVTIANLSRDTPATRAAILAQLQQIFFQRMPVSTVNEPFTLPVEWISEGIARATGTRRFTLVSPAADVPIALGSIAVPGAVNYQ